MQLIIADTNPNVVAALKLAFREHHDVLVNFGTIQSYRAQAVVSPANSFGWMDGGIDLVYLRWFGGDLETRLRQRIADEFDGELEVGKATCVHTVHPDIKYLISAPTMRTPGNVALTSNAYKAFKAALACAEDYGIESLLCPGMCTLTGGMRPEEAASQMLLAYQEHYKL